MTEAAIEFDQAMHTECSRCKEPALMHRLTASGNFYCLEPKYSWNSRRTSQTHDEQRIWAITKAKVNELMKSPLPKKIGEAINNNLRTPATPSGIQDALL